MMGLDNCRLAKAALYYIWIYGSLHQKINSTNFLGFFLKYTDKFFANNLSLTLWLSYALELFIETLLHIDTDEIQVKLSIRAEYAFYFVPFIFTKKTMVYEYAGQLFSDGS